VLRSQTKNVLARNVLLVEMISRSFKSIVRGLLRKLEHNSTEKQTELIADEINRLLGDTEDSVLFWDVSIRITLLNKFGGYNAPIFTPSESAQGMFGLKKGIDVLALLSSVCYQLNVRFQLPLQGAVKPFQLTLLTRMRSIQSKDEVSISVRMAQLMISFVAILFIHFYRGKMLWRASKKGIAPMRRRVLRCLLTALVLRKNHQMRDALRGVSCYNPLWLTCANQVCRLVRSQDLVASVEDIAETFKLRLTEGFPRINTDTCARLFGEAFPSALLICRDKHLQNGGGGNRCDVLRDARIIDEPPIVQYLANTRGVLEGIIDAFRTRDMVLDGEHSLFLDIKDDQQQQQQPQRQYEPDITEVGLYRICKNSPPKLLTNAKVTSCCCGVGFVLAVSEGRVLSVGRNDYGQLGTGDTQSRAIMEPITTMPVAM
jgi:hypothetical protein